MNLEIDLKSSRARQARMAKHIGKTGYKLLTYIIVLMVVIALAAFILGYHRIGYLALAVGLVSLMFAVWHKSQLASLPPRLPARRLDDILSGSLLARFNKDSLTPAKLWQTIEKDSPANFLCNHLLLNREVIAKGLSDNASDMAIIWHKAMELTGQRRDGEMHAGSIAAALILTSVAAMDYLKHYKLSEKDVLEVHEWLERLLNYLHAPKPYFGGFGRDWASGFTPTLERFSTNLSQSIEAGGGFAHFLAHDDLLDGMVNNLSRGSGVALVGQTGSGKTSLVNALAERLLEGKDKQLEYYQVVGLNASLILSSAGNQLERIMLTLFGEAVRAGNIILFLDEAQLFFGSGAGAFDLSQILMPIMNNHRLKVIAAMTPQDWQRLKINNESLSSSFAPTILSEPEEASTMKILEDSALLLEGRSKLLVSYEAVREAYRLSGQYLQEQAYPGKAIKLLEQAAPCAKDGLIIDETVQAAIEKTLGVKVGHAEAAEVDVLLNLEDKIHERMINQKRAVNVIASALRRGRAGVANPKRPVGSFLFLGPTGVGKTELAKSLAAVYFGDEHRMIRLDMSEYQQPEDVSRLLGGASGDNSLLMQIRQQPFSVILLDEVEKSHPNILNLLLQLLDEGQLTDSNDKPASFKSAIIIATSNAGAADIAARVKTSQNLDDFERPLIDKLIGSGQFKPELINRFDEVVLFRPLGQSELGQVAALMIKDVNKTLAAQNIQVSLTEAALAQVIQAGYDPEFGARPMRRVIQKSVEDAVAVKILSGAVQAGESLTLDVDDLATASKEATKEPSLAPEQQSNAPQPLDSNNLS
ncbi:MAG: AAA family ATPase [Candidatus Saccharimonadales bacterium]